MIARTLAIAGNTVREARRNKIFYSIFFFALLFILSSFLFTELTIALFDRILRDAATGFIDFFGAMIAIFLGVSLVSREVERKTVYTVVTKPLYRGEFIVGKFLGLAAVLTASLGVMFLCFLLVLYLWSTDAVVLAPLLWYFALTLVELYVVVAFAVLMSAFTGSALAAFSTVALYVIGHLTPDLHHFGAMSESAAVRWLSAGLYYLLPNLDRFSLSREVTYELPVDAGTALLASAGGMAWIATFLVGAAIVFGRRDFR